MIYAGIVLGISAGGYILGQSLSSFLGRLMVKKEFEDLEAIFLKRVSLIKLFEFQDINLKLFPKLLP